MNLDVASAIQNHDLELKVFYRVDKPRTEGGTVSGPWYAYLTRKNAQGQPVHTYCGDDKVDANKAIQAAYWTWRNRDHDTH